MLFSGGQAPGKAALSPERLRSLGHHRPRAIWSQFPRRRKPICLTPKLKITLLGFFIYVIDGMNAF